MAKYIPDASAVTAQRDDRAEVMQPIWELPPNAMMSNGTAYLFISPWVIIFPGLAMMLTVLGFNLFGDALIDFLDVKNKESN